MNVAELKKALEQYPDDMEILYCLYSDYAKLEPDDIFTVEAVDKNGYHMRAHSTMSAENQAAKENLFAISRQLTMIELDEAPLPPPSKRGRKPKAVTYSTPTGVQRSWVENRFKAATVEDRPRSKCCGRDLVYEGCFCSVPDDGWRGKVEAKRFPTPGLTMMVGGPFNGQELDLSTYGQAKIIRVPYKRDPAAWAVDSYEWYERGRIHGYVWCGRDDAKGFEIVERILSAD